MKDNHFKLSSSFTNLFTEKGTSAPAKKQSGNHSLDKGLFKLNPKSAGVLNDVPVQMLKKKSKNKLESLKDDSIEKKFSIFQQKMQTKEIVRDKKIEPKKYHLDIHKSEGPKIENSSNNKKVEELPYDIVRPSRLDTLNSEKEKNQNLGATLFQTPLLPCFSSEFRPSLKSNTVNQFKILEEKEGVWKIGKIKIKGKKANLNIGGIQFEATQAVVSGKAGVVDSDNYYELPNWKNIWVVQPSQELFI